MSESSLRLMHSRVHTGITIVANAPTANAHSTMRRSGTMLSEDESGVGAKKVSPKRCDTATRDEVEAARHASALRSEERQRQAEERRLDFRQEQKLKANRACCRSAQAKARRESALERQRTEADTRMAHHCRRAEEARRQTVERAQRGHFRLEEVRLTNELRQQTKALLLDRRMSEAEQNMEQLREGRQRAALERQEAAAAAAARRRHLSEEKIERHMQREQQRQDILRRVEDVRRAEMASKQQRAEEWERRVLQRQQHAHAESEALSRKVEERLHMSAQLREEQRERLRLRGERQDMRLREVKQRRDRELLENKCACNENNSNSMSGNNHTNTVNGSSNGGSGGAQNNKSCANTLMHNAMARMHYREEEHVAARVAKATNAMLRHGMAFEDTYRKEALLSTKELNRSKLRPLWTRVQATLTNVSIAQCRAPLHDILATIWDSTDHEYMRYFNHFGTLLKLITEARKARQEAVIQLAMALLQWMFVQEDEGAAHALYAARSGSLFGLMLCVRESMLGTMSQISSSSDNSSNSVTTASTLARMVSLVGVCVERVVIATSGMVRLLSVRDQLLHDMETISLQRMCMTMLRLSPHEECLSLHHAALRILYAWLSLLTRRRGETRPVWFANVTMALLTLWQNLLIEAESFSAPTSAASASGNYLTDDVKMSSTRMTVLFGVLRVMNTLARWQLDVFQEVLRGGVVMNSVDATPAVTTMCISGAESSTIMETKSASSATASAANETTTVVHITRLELFHILNAFVNYIKKFANYLEPISQYPSQQQSALPPSSLQHPLVPCKSAAETVVANGHMEDALRFGLTLPGLPSVPPATEQQQQDDKKKEGGQSDSDYVPGGRHYPLRATLHECLLFMGYISLDNPEVQEIFSWGRSPTLLGNLLSVLPSSYFSNAQLVFFPTLLTVLYDNDCNTSIAKAQMSLTPLHTFLTSEFDALSKRAKLYAQEHHRALMVYKLKADPRRALRLSMRGKNWAQLTDDDSCAVVSNKTSDDITVAALHANKIDASSLADDVEISPSTEKAKLCKALRGAAMSECDYFRLERRFPVSYWPSMTQQLNEILHPH